MSLTFPNRSRSYDDANRRIRFSGYDGMFEVKFFLELDGLAKVHYGRLTGEREYLSAFDDSREKILAAAEKAYGRGQKTMCTLTHSDFS
ncbi:MAG: DUF1488 domain-containing protein [Oxalobacteraceae bacterium]|nr:MAG: DUF1488 domain-containing protein [Oxalobacteraceae bacterium]